MSTNTKAYPLHWPTGWPRTSPSKRQEATFSTKSHSAAGKVSALTVYDALVRLQRQIDLLGGSHAVISSNVELRLDGMPRSAAKPPDDPGVCLYFQLKGQPTTLPCDHFNRVADNIAAIAAHIDATRRIERYGVGTLAQMFTGFQAIRGPGPKPWRETLGIPAEQVVTPAYVRQRKHELAAKLHPDVGGTETMMAEVNAAADQAIREISQ